MKSKIDAMLERITWKHWIVFLLFSQMVYAIMLIYTIPNVQNEAGGMKIFDLQLLGYSFDYAQEFFSLLTERGYTLYKCVQLPIDILYPFLNFLVGISSLALLKRGLEKLTGESDPLKFTWATYFMLMLTFFSMIFDYLENIMVFTMLSRRGLVSSGFVKVSSLFTIAKSLSTTFFYSICLIVCLAIAILWFYKKFKGSHTNE